MDKQYLDWHGRQWRVQMKVPEGLRAIFGTAKLLAPLHTDSLTEANRLKWAHVAAFKSALERARKAAVGQNGAEIDEAIILRNALERAERDRDERGHNGAPAVTTSLRQIADRFVAIETSHGAARASEFLQVANSFGTPIREHVEAWLADADFKDSTKAGRRQAIRLLEDWCRREHLPATIGTIGRRTAGEFIAEAIRPGRHATTANRIISDLSAFWTWLMRRDYAEANPWRDQKLPIPRKHMRRNGGKRPPTDNEMVKLLTGPADRRLHDLIRIAALSGMRLEEICELRVSDCEDGEFIIRSAKSAAGVRRVPIHPDLAAIIAQRRAEKPAAAFLIDDLPDTAGRPRKAPASQSFTRYRKALGIDDKPDPEQRQSNVDFHSLRRWFTTKAEQAGEPPHIIEAVTGHVRHGMGLGRYSAGPSCEQFKACIEAVRLPSLPMEVPEPPPTRARSTSNLRRKRGHRGFIGSSPKVEAGD